MYSAFLGVDAMSSAPHPLAATLIERLQSRARGSVLDFAAGSGRNTRALRAAGFVVVAIDDVAAASESPFAGVHDRFDAALSTHGLLHGTLASVASRLDAIGGRLVPCGLLYATFGSIDDARFGHGKRFDDATFAPDDGDEAGVAHVYFDRDRLVGLLKPHFEIESLDEHRVDDIVGTWAHAQRPLRGAAHWFVTARKR
jgi:Methyltransferase domain